MRSGEIEASLLTLNEDFRLPFLQELIAQKLTGPEKASLNGAEISFHEVEVNRLRQELETAHATTRLQELPSEETRSRLSKLLVRLRINPPVRGIIRIGLAVTAAVVLLAQYPLVAYGHGTPDSAYLVFRGKFLIRVCQV
jgi:hypothetical protein